MFTIRDDEPGYAFIPDADAPESNRYGKRILLAEENDPLAGKSLHINGDAAIGAGPNRYKQHGFYFNADNCIACHACESACSEKNDLPPYLAYRAVGYVEGGSYPDYTRLNISMACNHCDNPVCLKGCPTRAYTKFAEYGAVLQDPDICFGCGYCTWVCPYNAPQLDLKRGHVHKCNMCVDRLEVGLKPACASACLAGALDFGVIETRPEQREQLQNRIPGFPTPEITHPNIRFQQRRSLPQELLRTDAMPLRYERAAQGEGGFITRVRKIREGKRWSLGRLHSRENPLVIFTLITQAVIGAFVVLFLAPMLGLEQLAAATHPATYMTVLFALLGLQTFALGLSTLHLGRPHRFYRAFNNLRYSPVSREVAGVAVFYNLLAAYTMVNVVPGLNGLLPAALINGAQQLFGWGAAGAGLIAIYFMQRIYRIPARPFWNHWQVLSSFYGTMLSLGALLVGLVYAGVLLYQGRPFAGLMQLLAVPLVLGLVLEAYGLYRHARQMRLQGGEGEASHYEQCTTFGYTYLARNIGLALGTALVLIWMLSAVDGPAAYLGWLFTALLIVVTAVVGRALFYVLVIPTTMPGAFFWRNQGFQEHARESGLAEMQQAGVLADTH